MAKIGSFIGSIVLFIVSAALSVLIYSISESIPTEGIVGAIGMLLFIPLAIMFFLLLISSLITGTVAAIRAVMSEIKAIRIISIIIIILYVGLIIFNALLGFQIFSTL